MEEESDKIFIQTHVAETYREFMRRVWNRYPTLIYNQARKKTAQLWKARMKWVKGLEPTLKTLRYRCSVCKGSPHGIGLVIPKVESDYPIRSSYNGSQFASEGCGYQGKSCNSYD
jgi:hypothetical protein